ncbi:MAG: M3 family oligoendopeptidase [Candidatus Muiribacteriaceae bacterium]
MNITDIDSVIKQMDAYINTTPETPEEYEELILSWEKFKDFTQEEISLRSLAYSLNTSDSKAKEEYSYLIKNLIPMLMQKEKEFLDNILESDFRETLPVERWGVYIKRAWVEKELFNEKNIDLIKEDMLLSQEYVSLIGNTKAVINGKQMTVKKASSRLEDPDREIREKAFRAIFKANLANREKINSIYDRLVRLRKDISENAGTFDYNSYMFKAKYRFDYTRDDCRRIHSLIEKYFVPLKKEILLKHKKRAGLDVLRPWDIRFDSRGENKIKPFENTDELVEKIHTLFAGLDPELGVLFNRMKEKDLLDLDNRDGKAPGGFMMRLKNRRMPFIFANMTGVVKDVGTLLHESGHAFHYLLSCDKDPQMNTTHEFSEVASTAMEYLGLPHLKGLFFDEDEFERVKQEHFEGVIKLFVWVAMVDAFQLWVYENPDCSIREREEYWKSLEDRFGTGLIDNSGFEEVLYTRWQRQHHIFRAPLYYIEYAISQIGALQLWQNSLKDLSGTISKYKMALRQGGDRSIPELYKLAGIRFAFDEDMISSLATSIKNS